MTWRDGYRSANGRCGAGRRWDCCRRRCIRTPVARAGAPPIWSATWRNSPHTQDREIIVEKRYRVVPPLQGNPSDRSLTDRIYTERESDQPDHPSCYEGEWVCSHSPCPVRAVRLRVKALFHQHLPRLRCPLCLRTLVFRHWLNIVELQEVPPEPAVETVALPSRRKPTSRTRRRKAAPGKAAG